MVGLTRLRGPHGFCYIHRMWQDSKDSPISFFKKIFNSGLPCWLSGKEPASNARDTGSVPDPGRSHMPRRNSLCTTTIESVL